MASKSHPKKKSDYSHYDTYVYKIFKMQHPDKGMGSGALEVLDGMVHYIICRVMANVNVLKVQQKFSVVGSRHIQTAVRIAFPGELAKNGVSEGTKAVAKYTTNQSRRKGSKEKISAQNLAGIQMPVARVRKEMKSHIAGCECSLGETAAVYLAAVIEYIIEEVCQLGGNAARDLKHLRLTTRDLTIAVRGDQELDDFFKDLVFSAGVIPHVPVQLLKKGKKGK